MNDDWKGADKIRLKGTINRRKEATRLVNVIYHMQRRAQGVPCAAKHKHNALVFYGSPRDRRRKPLASESIESPPIAGEPVSEAN